MQTEKDFVVRQTQLLKNFSRVSKALEGVAAFLWLPGRDHRFDGPRRITGTRPLAVSLEAGAAGSLTFGVSKSRPVHGKLRYECIMKKDLTQPFTKEGRGAALCLGNSVMVRRALSLLATIVRFGEKRAFQPKAVKLGEPRHPLFLVPFNAGEEQIDQAKLTAIATQLRGGLGTVEAQRERVLSGLVHTPTELSGTKLVDARIVTDAALSVAVTQETGYEDFSPVLGVPHQNPMRVLNEMPNPAAELLQARGISDVGQLDQDAVDELVRAFREAVLLSERLAEEEIFDALCNPSAPVVCAKGVEDIADVKVIAAMRRAAGNSRAAWEATDHDLLEAAYRPSSPLFLSRLSCTQLVSAGDLAVLPAPYAGDFLPDPEWQPPRRKAAPVTA